MPKAQFDTPEVRQIIRAAKAHRQKAKTELWDRYNRWVRVTCLSVLRKEDLLEDAVQNTYVSILRGINNFRGKSELRTWITRIAVNESLMLLRKEQKVLGLEVPLEIESEEGHEQIELPDFKKVVTIERLMLHEAIRRLPLAEYRTFQLYLMEGYTTLEVANKLGISNPASKTRKLRLRKKLRHLVEGSSASNDTLVQNR